MQKQFDIVGRRKLWLSIALTVMLVGFGSMVLFKAQTGQALNWGLDFTGGAQFEFKLPKKVAVGYAQERRVTEEVRQLLKKAGLTSFDITLSEGDIILVRTQARDQNQMAQQRQLALKALSTRYSGVSEQASELIGPVIGEELRKAAILGTVIGLIGVMIYIWVRYALEFGFAAMIAMLHDVLVLLGFMSIFRIEVNSPFVALLLTVVGYSVNDTVVIFDRIRANMKHPTRKSWRFAEIVNYSLVETMPRSINTGLGAQFALITMILFGSADIRDMALSLLIGITSGTYSSIFIAALLVVWWRQYKDRKERPWMAREVASPAAGRGRPVRPSLRPERPTAEAMAEPVEVADEEEAGGEAITRQPVPAGAGAPRTPKKRRGTGRGKRRRRY